MGLAVARIRVSRDRHQALAGQRRCRCLRERVDVLRHLVTVVLAAELDGALRGLGQRHARGRRPCGTRARSRRRSRPARRRDPSPQSPAASFFASIAAAWAARVIAWIVWLPPEMHVHGRCLAVLPHVMSHFSHGTSRISATTRCTSITEWVPRLPTPDWIASRPSGLMTNSPSKPTEPAMYGLTATPIPRTFEPSRCLRTCLAPFPLEQLGAAIERFLHERARHVPRRPFGPAGPTGACPSGALMRRICDLIDPELCAPPSRAPAR